MSVEEPHVPLHSPGTRVLILDAADAFLKDHHFRDLTVTALMQATSVTRPAFYQYFHSRYDVAAALIGRLAEAAAASAAVMFDMTLDPVQACDAGIRTTVENIGPHAYVVRALRDGAASDARLEAIWQEVFVQPYAAAVARRVRLDQAAGSTSLDINPDLIGIALFTATATMLYDYSATLGDAGERERVADALSRIWCGTLYGRL